MREDFYNHKSKTSFYIDKDNKERIKKFISNRLQTKFINNAIREALLKEEQKILRLKAQESLESCPIFKIEENSVDIIRSIRGQRDERLIDTLNID